MSGWLPPQDDAERLLVRRVGELAAAAYRSGSYRFVGFLDERGCALAAAALHAAPAQSAFWGGYEGARRQYLGLGGEGAPPPQAFPLAAVHIQCAGRPGDAPPTHRDYLGALLGLGIARTCVGDILPEGAGALCFVEACMAPLVCRQLVSVGRFSATVSEADAAAAQGWRQPVQPCRVSVPSLRADAVLAALLHLSRQAAADLIRRGAVALDGVQLSGLHTAVQPGDQLSVRGYGHWQIGAPEGQSKKGRIWLSAQRFVG